MDALRRDGEPPERAPGRARRLEEREEQLSALPSPPDEERPGHELHEITPACLGGVLSVDNLVLLPIADHAELCRFWNKVYRRLRAERRRGPP